MSQSYSPAADSALVRDCRLELAIMAELDGEQYVESRDIADRTEYNTHQVATAMVVLEREGVVEKWSGGRQTTYRITI